MWLVLILSCTLLFLFLYKRLRLPLRYWKDRGIAHPSPSIIIGNLGPTVRRKETLNKLLQKTSEEYEHQRYFGFYEFSKPELVILDRELIKEIFVKNFDSFTDHFDFLPKDVDTFWKKGLFAREGNDWHDMRVTLSPTFTSKKMKAMFHLVDECSKRFVDHFLKKNETVTLEIMEAFCKFNNDVIASCTFGVHCDSLENEKNEFNVMATEAFDFSGLKSLKFFGNSLSPTLSRFFRVKMFSNKIRDFYVRITKEAIDYRKKTGLHRPDVIHLLMEAQKGRLNFEEDDEDITSGFAGIEDSYSRKSTKKIQITDEDIASQIVVFFFGSHDTISVTLSQTVYELVANTHVQGKLIKEIDLTLKSCEGGKITYQALFQMKYLDMVVTETLRLWAPPHYLNRRCVKPFVIEPVLPHEKSLLIEPGIEVIIPIDAFHKNPKYFKNPETFDPERFSNENRDNIKPFTYFPFGVGPRHCIGNRFALMVVKLMIVNLLTHFRIIPVEKTVIPFERRKDGVMLRSAHGYWFGLKPRMGKI